jgi:hypothetical protein
MARLSNLARQIREANGPHVCKDCNALYVPDYSAVPNDGPFIDPFEFNRRRILCAQCLKKET